MFIFIAGISLVLSYNRVTKSKKFYLKRGLKIFGLGLLITLVTFFLFPEEFIIFGILHLIGVAIIFSIPFLNLKKLNLILGLSIILIGFLLENLRFDFSWLLWLGLKPKSFITLDYFPIFPWFGVILLGIFIGNTIYKKGKRSFKIKDCSNLFLIKQISILGRNSLIIYLLHQPILFLILMLLGFSLFI